jgi:hypothetical protein
MTRSTVLLLMLVGIGLFAAAGAQSGARSAAWAWSAPVPRELAAAGNFTLVAAPEDGLLLIGAAVDGRADLQPLETLAGDRPVVVFSAASGDATGQAVVGVARSDVDRVAVMLADGTQTDLPLNEWRGFSYVATASDRAAVEVDAYAGGTSLGAIRLPRTTTPSAADVAAAPVYGIARESFTAQTIRLSRLDSRTLQPVSGPSLLLRSQIAGPVALSPDQQRLALVTTNAEPSARSQLRIVDLPTMRVLRTFSLPKNLIRGLSWPEQNRLVELRQTMGPPYNRNVRSRVAWAVDPSSGAHVGTGTLTNKLAIRQAISTLAGLVLLLGTSGLRERADSQVAVVSPDGAVKSVTVPLRSIKHARLTSRMAVDSAASHAYVVAEGGVVFDVDLGAMSVVRHQLTPPTGAASVPAAIGILDAETVGGKIALAGVFAARGGGVAQGVVLVDPKDWTARLVDPGAARFAVAGDRLVTFGPSLRPLVFHGVSVYDASGVLIAHLYGKRAFYELLLTPGYGHAIYNGPSTVKQVPKIGPPRFLGWNDQLVFALRDGAARGSGRLSSAKPPLGAPMLIFRGSDMVGEAGDRQPS